MQVFIALCGVAGVAAFAVPRLRALNDQPDENYGYGWRVYYAVTKLPPAADVPVPCCALEHQPGLKAFAAMVPPELCQTGHIAMYLEHLYSIDEPTDGCMSERSYAAMRECWPVDTHECFKIVGKFIADDRRRRYQESQTEEGGE